MEPPTVHAAISAAEEQSCFANLFQPAPGTWKCPCCSVVNEPELEKCPCCETLRCTTKKPEVVAPATPKPSDFKYDMSLFMPGGCDAYINPCSTSTSTSFGGVNSADAAPPPVIFAGPPGGSREATPAFGTPSCFVESPKTSQYSITAPIEEAEFAILQSPAGRTNVACWVYCWGSAECDQLPVPNCAKDEFGSVTAPLKVPFLDDVKQRARQVACGTMHTALLMNTGTIYTFGCNDDSCLGRVTALHESESDDPEGSGEQADHRSGVISGREDYPGPVDGLPDGLSAISVSCGDCHTAVVLEDGSCWIWGCYKDYDGAIGLPVNYKQFTIARKSVKPIKVEPLPKCLKVVSGENHTAALVERPGTSARDVYMWGSNEFGQLARPLASSPTVENPTVDKSEFLRPEVVRLPDGYEVGDVYCGGATTFITDSSHTVVYAVGRNSTGELSRSTMTEAEATLEKVLLPTNSLRVKDIRGTAFATLLLSESGDVYITGKRDYCGLGGLPHNITVFEKIDCLAGKVSSIGAGGHTFYAITRRGVLVAWGEAQNYQLGDGNEYMDPVLNPLVIHPRTFDHRPLAAIAAGSQHAIALVYPPDMDDDDEPSRARSKRPRSGGDDEPEVRTGKQARIGTREDIGAAEVAGPQPTAENEVVPEVKKPPAKKSTRKNAALKLDAEKDAQPPSDEPKRRVTRSRANEKALEASQTAGGAREGVKSRGGPKAAKTEAREKARPPAKTESSSKKAEDSGPSTKRAPRGCSGKDKDLIAAVAGKTRAARRKME